MKIDLTTTLLVMVRIAIVLSGKAGVWNKLICRAGQTEVTQSGQSRYAGSREQRERVKGW